MGGGTASKDHASSNGKGVMPIPACLEVLASPTSTLAERRAAFETAQAEFAASIAETPAYAAELRQVFALRYEPWTNGGVSTLPEGATHLSMETLADRIRGIIF